MNSPSLVVEKDFSILKLFRATMASGVGKEY